MPKQQRETGKPQNLSISNKERNEVRASLLQLGNNPDHGHEVKLAIQISHLSTKLQVLRSLDIRVFCIILLFFNVFVPQNK